MKQSGQKSKLCVTLIACIITIYGKIFCILSRPSTYILDVAISDVAISEAVGGSLLQLWVVLWPLGEMLVLALVLKECAFIIDNHVHVC